MKARVAVLAALVAAVTVTSVAVTASGAARQDSSSALDAAIVSQWNATAQAEAVLLRPTAHGQSRGIAMVEGAVYDAVNAIDGGYQPYLLGARFDPEGSEGAAAATAAYRVLLAITPLARHAGLDAAYAATLATIPDGAAKQEGVDAGEAAAAAMLAFRQGDGFLAPFTPVIGTDAGDWRPIGWPDAPIFDPDGWVGNSKPFLIESQSQFRSEGPNPLTSAAVRGGLQRGEGAGRAEQLEAHRRPDEGRRLLAVRAHRTLESVARGLADRYDLEAADQARLYAMINLAAADGAIACWNDKYYWNFWRPRAAIREADTDGNPATVADPNWESLFAPATADHTAARNAAVPGPSLGPRLP